MKTVKKKTVKISANDDKPFANIFSNKPTVLTESPNTVKLTSSVLQPHLFDKTAYYQTAVFPNFNVMVCFFHEA